MPAFMLKKIVLGNFASGPLDPEMADGIDFMVDRVGTCVLSYAVMFISVEDLLSRRLWIFLLLSSFTYPGGRRKGWILGR